MHSHLRFAFHFMLNIKALKISIFTMLIFVACCSSHLPLVWANDIPIQALHGFIDNGAYALQIPGETRRSLNINTPLIPASTIKVLTGLMALETLGPQYRFTTYFYRDDLGNLYVKGEGDPFLTSEAVEQIAWKLKQLNIDNINTLIFDSTAYALEGPPDQSANTDNPYDVSSAALAVNFNTIAFIVAKNRKVVSAEKQTPLLPIMENLGSLYPPGSHRINVNSLPAKDNLTNTIRYCGELFTALLKQQGIRVANGFTTGKVAQNTAPVLAYTSEKTVTDLVRLCLQYSTNFIANQLFLTCGSKSFGNPATWKKAVMAGQQYRFQHLGLTSSEIHQVDGSGLSKQNRITTAAMLIILERFRPYAELLPKQQSIYVKSGTLSNVYSYVGYFPQSQALSTFVILLNQKRNTRDTVLEILKKEHSRIIQSP
jgi:serine-type D-Ala-D-Ala carboxypeptidase/endopeptidase (penicillin-binding protein 4)